MTERKIKNNFLAALIIAGIAYVIGFIGGIVLMGFQNVLIYQMGVPTLLYSLISLPLSVVISVVAFVVAAIVYFAGIEKMKLNVGLTIGAAFIQAIVRTIASFVIGMIFSAFIYRFMGYNQGVQSIYSFILFVVSMAVLFVASIVLVSMSMKNVAVNPVQMNRPVQPGYPVQQPVYQTQSGETVVLSELVQQPQPVVQEAPVQQEAPAPQPNQPAFCPNCGQKVIEGNQFCIYCGSAYTNN